MERIKVTEDRTLRAELEALGRLADRGDLGLGESSRIRLVVKNAEDILRHDWTDDEEFSDWLEDRLEPLKARI